MLSRICLKNSVTKKKKKKQKKTYWTNLINRNSIKKEQGVTKGGKLLVNMIVMRL